MKQHGNKYFAGRHPLPNVNSVVEEMGRIDVLWFISFSK